MDSAQPRTDRQAIGKSESRLVTCFRRGSLHLADIVMANPILILPFTKPGCHIEVDDDRISTLIEFKRAAKAMSSGTRTLRARLSLMNTEVNAKGQIDIVDWSRRQGATNRRTEKPKHGRWR